MSFEKLTEKQKEIFREVAEDYFQDSLIFHPEYSGRGMMGKRTYGVSGNLKDVAFFLQMLGAELERENEELIPDFSYDSLGFGIILYVF